MTKLTVMLCNLRLLASTLFGSPNTDFMANFVRLSSTFVGTSFIPTTLRWNYCRRGQTMIAIRKAIPDDGKDFSELMLMSAPYFTILFGDNIKTVLQGLFRYRSNLFSFEHVCFAQVDGEKTGMILGYDWQVKKRENLKTGLLLFKYMGVRILCKFLSLMKFNTTVGKVCDGEYYVSNIAIYTPFRGRGVGKILIHNAEQEAKMVDAERIVLDVEKENISAISFYKGLGYKIIKEFSRSLQGNKILHFYRMIKQLKE